MGFRGTLQKSRFWWVKIDPYFKSFAQGSPASAPLCSVFRGKSGCYNKPRFRVKGLGFRVWGLGFSVIIGLTTIVNDINLHYLKDPKVWELGYIPSYCVMQDLYHQPYG